MSTAVEAPAHHPPPTKKRKPSSRACQPCRELHKSCSSGRPCDRCVKHGRAHLCVTPAPKPKRSAKMMQLTTNPTTVAPALSTFSTPLLQTMESTPSPAPTGNEFIDTDSQIQHLQLQLRQLQSMQHQQQVLRQNPPQPYKFGLDQPSAPKPPSAVHTPNQTLSRPSPGGLPPLTPTNSLAQPLTPITLQPLTPQPYASPLLMLPSVPLTASATGPVFPPSSPGPTLEQLAVHYNVRLDASSDGQVPLDADTRDFIANAMNTNTLSSSMSDLYNNSVSGSDFDPESLFVQQFATDPVTDDGGSSDDDAMLTDGTGLGGALSPTGTHHESTTATPVEGMNSGSSPLSSSGGGHMTMTLCDEEVATPGGTKSMHQSIVIPRGPLSDEDVDKIVTKMGSLTMCPIKAAELAKAQQDLQLNRQPQNDSAPVIAQCQQKITEMMWRLADKTGHSEMTPEINTVLHKLMGVMLPKASLFDASAVPYASLVHKFKVTLQMASEMAQPVVLLNARRHVIYANDHFHNLTGNLFVDTRLYDFEVFHPDDALRYMSYAMDKLADRTSDARMRFKVLSLASISGFVECIVTPHVLFEQLTTMPMFLMVNFTRVDDIPPLPAQTTSK